MLLPQHFVLGENAWSEVPAPEPAKLERAARPGAGPATPGEVALSDEVGALERQRILEALERFGGNQTKAAQALGISRRTMLNRLDAYGVQRPRKR
jgi:DNA-binding NtrC family response regulator